MEAQIALNKQKRSGFPFLILFIIIILIIFISLVSCQKPLCSTYTSQGPRYYLYPVKHDKQKAVNGIDRAAWSRMRIEYPPKPLHQSK